MLLSVLLRHLLHLFQQVSDRLALFEVGRADDELHFARFAANPEPLWRNAHGGTCLDKRVDQIFAEICDVDNVKQYPESRSMTPGLWQLCTYTVLLIS